MRRNRAFGLSFLADEQERKKFGGSARGSDRDGLSRVGADQYERLHRAGAQERGARPEVEREQRRDLPAGHRLGHERSDAGRRENASHSAARQSWRQSERSAEVNVVVDLPRQREAAGRVHTSCSSMASLPRCVMRYWTDSTPVGRATTKPPFARRSSVTRVLNLRTLRPRSPAPISCFKTSRSARFRTIVFGPRHKRSGSVHQAFDAASTSLASCGRAAPSKGRLPSGPDTDCLKRPLLQRPGTT
jgi:hypothetical protein